MALFKRILEISGVFVPQTWKFPYGWCATDRVDGQIWTITEGQVRYCSYKTLEEAKQRFPKTHKV